MPTYDYRCERTGEMFELWQSFSDDALTECPQTHKGEKKICKAPVKKVFSKVGIAFKGDGFYKNDHGSSSKPPKESGANSSSESSSSSSSSTSDTSTTTSSSDTSSGKSSPKKKSSSASNKSGATD
ncbi:MAG: zinc ribbon domain-containing protein [Acidimicrobiales bacterium]